MSTTYEFLVSLSPFSLGERYYVTFALWHEPSVRPYASVRLSVVYDVVAPYAETSTFRQYFCTISQGFGLFVTRKSSVDEIGGRYRLNPAMVVKLFHPYSIPRNVRLSHRQIATFSAHREFF